MKRSSTWSALIAVAAAYGLLAFILRSALGGPPSAPRPDDIAKAGKDVPAIGGRDERVSASLEVAVCPDDAAAAAVEGAPGWGLDIEARWQVRGDQILCTARARRP